MTRGGCPLCGTEGHACGQPFIGTPFDLPRSETAVTGEVKRYNVTVNGTSTVLKLTAEDAKKYEDATPVDDAVTPPETPVEHKAVEPANKARTVQNKGRGRGSAGNR